MSGVIKMEKKLLFNPQGSRDKIQQRLIHGNSTNLLEFQNCKYEWAEQLYRKMRQFFWVPEEVPLGDDKLMFPRLTEAEQEAYKKTLSFLIFLDSIQVDNLSAISLYVTAPEVVACLKTQAFFETIHAQSYDYLLTSVVDRLTRDEVYYMWKDDEHLLRRNRLITDQYQSFINDPTEENFVKSSMADFLLEGIYFYSGFAFFYSLGRQDKMGGTVSLIRLIQRDENTHLALFTNIMRTLKEENPEVFTPQLESDLVEMLKTAVSHEIEWGHYVTKNQILGLSDQLIDRYIKYLGNSRAAAIGMAQPYDVRENPMGWVDTYATMNETKTDFFERKVTNYTKSAGSLKFDNLKPLKKNE